MEDNITETLRNAFAVFAYVFSFLVAVGAALIFIKLLIRVIF